MSFQKAVGRLLSLLLVACGCAAAQAQDARYAEYGFSFQPPAGWQEDRSAAGNVRVQYLGPRRNDRSQPSLNLSIQNYAINLTDQQINSMADDMVANYKSLGWRDAQVVDRRKISGAGYDALQLDMAYNQDGVPMRSRQVYVPVAEHKRTYLFTFIDTASHFDETIPAAAAAINSFSPALSRAYGSGPDAADTRAGLFGRSPADWLLIAVAAVALIVVITAAYLLIRKR